ncbi:EAL domain-containing protein [Lacisediminimonas profundi]|uniref:EAL domain-containing protein n=1 Tax=Lacisediminimonas profundi TaxID=2603856 RepID=UPI00124B3BE5|nr:EAL domain-containing protein [Lacisediminimonas profundi]
MGKFLPAQKLDCQRRQQIKSVGWRFLCQRYWACNLLLWSFLFTFSGEGAAQSLRVGLYENPPKVFTDESGRPTGSLVQLLQEIAKVEGWSLQFEPCEWQDCLVRLEAGELDLMPDVALTDERQKRLDFHKTPAMVSWSQLYRRPDARIDSLLDLQGKRIAVLAGGVQLDALKSALAGFSITAVFVEVESVSEAFELTASGKVDAAAASMHFGDYSAGAYGLKATPVVFNPSRLYYASSTGKHQAELNAIDRHLERWLKDDQSPYFTVLGRWGVRYIDKPLPAVVVNSLIGFGVAVLTLGAGVWWLRRRVRLALQDLQASNQQLRATLGAIPDLLFELDASGRYLEIHTTQENLLAAPMSALKGHTIDDVMPPVAAMAVHAVIRKAIDEGQSSGEAIRLAVDGGTHWFELSAARKPMPDGQAPNVLILSRDVTQRIKDQERIRHLADFDQLTGLPNQVQLHRLFEQALVMAQRHASKLAVIFMDLDHFKHVNDSLGHEAGDQLLVEVARRLTEIRRDADIACRMGGDEFIMVLPETDSAQAAQIATKIRDRIHQPYLIGESEVSVGISLGIAMFPEDGTDIDVLSRKADAALYQSKSEARNDFRFFTQSMQQRSARILALTGALSQALEKGQIDAHYQPLVSLSSGKVTGAEALIRWSHPQLGSVPPSEFIPLAESAGLILPLGDWMLRQAVGMARRLHDAGYQMTVAVNISVVQFRHADFLKTVAAALTEHRLPPDLLELEVTESLTMGDPEAAILTMHELRELGVKLAIDDFGTGYSSMSYLSRLGFNKLKIDQSFVRGIGKVPDDEAIVEAVINLAHSLGIETLAEGVETMAQREFLVAMGCDLIQGWLVSHALRDDEFMSFIEQAGVSQLVPETRPG